MDVFDLDFLSESLGTVGLFFVSCAIIHKKPKHILEELFGVYKGGLRSLKASVFKKNQLILGFCCVVAGLIIHQFSHVLARRDGASLLDKEAASTLVSVWLLFVVLLCAVLNYLCRVWSKWHFKRVIAEVSTEHKWPFAENMALTLEIGHLLGVRRDDDDTVERYVVKLKSHLALPVEEERPRSPSRKGSLGLSFK